MSIRIPTLGVVLLLATACSPSIPEGAPQTCFEFDLSRSNERAEAELIAALHGFADKNQLSFSDQSKEFSQLNNEPGRKALRLYDRHTLISANWGFSFGSSICITVDAKQRSMEDLSGQIHQLLAKLEVPSKSRTIRP
jgi:hypothetical protein